MASFDLLRRPWLNVAHGGRTELVDLRTFFYQAHRFDDLVVPLPPAAAGLWRILYAIAARVTGLDDPGLNAAAWIAARNAVAEQGAFDPVRVDAYFDRWSDRFDLFHPQRPWLQDPRLLDQCAKSSGINKLVFGRPSGNNQVWFGHFADTRPMPLPAAEAALHLIAQTYYGASGRCTSRTINGVSEANTSAGPLRQIMSYHPIGSTVFETLLAGLPDTHQRLVDDATVPDACPWEWAELSDPLGLPTAPTWPGAMLTTRSRHAILLRADATGDTAVDAYITWAWRAPARPHRDPYAIGERSKEGNWYARRADANRALWRDLDALLTYGDSGDGLGRPPVLSSCTSLPYLNSIRVRAFGFDQDGQARDSQWFVATTPPVLGWMEEIDPARAESVRIAREAAETVGRQLGRALRDAWKQVTQHEGQWPVRAATYYWPRAEEAFWAFLTEPSAEQLAEPTRPFLVVATEAIEYAIGNRDRMPMARAFNHAQRRLRALVRQGERV